MTTFSIITTVDNPPQDVFTNCAYSVLEQTYDGWEWCLAHSSSTNDAVRTYLSELQRSDKRIRVIDRASMKSRIDALNAALALATAEFLVLLNDLDELSPNALHLLANTIASQPEADYLYSDEDRIDLNGNQFDQFLKPDWSPERLLAHNYTGRLSILRRSLVDHVGRFRDGYDDSWDNDLVFRVTEKSRYIMHLPHVLYHRRLVTTCNEAYSVDKSSVPGSGPRAVKEHLERHKVDAEIDDSIPNVVRVRRTNHREPEVTIIVPVDQSYTTVLGDETTLTTSAIQALAQRTSYRNYRILLVAPQRVSDQDILSLAEYFDRPVNVVRPNEELKRTDLFNYGLVACDTKRAVLFDQYNEIIDDDWLQTLLGYEDRERVAMIAPVVVDVNGSIISAGLATTPVLHHIGQNYQHNDLIMNGMLVVARECFGVATHCALIDVAVVKTVGGFHTAFQSRYRDFDLARKLQAFGFHAIVTPLTCVRSFEIERENESERELFESRWRWLPIVDPYIRTDTRKLGTLPH